ncbi:cupin domain-containing protein [Micromonospora chalcea]|uniref:cupin domain-containing protein n=1 Tax=Micromonospora chalcea TaxID=1874 RepID=UPI00381D3C35
MASGAIPSDDPTRTLVHARPDDPGLAHLAIAGGTYTILVTGEQTVARAGETVNIPANAPHFFRNSFDQPARLLCMCTPAGQDEYFLRVGDRVDGPTSPPPALTEEEQAERRDRAAALASDYRTELLIG